MGGSNPPCATIVLVGLLFFGLVGCASPFQSQGANQKPAVPEVILATTTSVYDTGLLDALIPSFEKETGYQVKTIAVGSGAALAMGERGEADVLLTHDPESEAKLVGEGAVLNRTTIMHNFFLVVGPSGDPTGIQGGRDAPVAMRKIAAAKALFVSRGDDSGTHVKEKKLWSAAGVSPSGSWYQVTGQGMGQTLVVASEKVAYTLTDKGTFLSLKKNLTLEAMVEDAPQLLNTYSVMQVNPQRFSRVNGTGGEALVRYLTSSQVQTQIASFGVAKFGEPLFIPDLEKREKTAR
ncbi:MAG: substrate-binding domain-containing protein [Chloroflexi bacterium]|nr:substrate-binding domain-containing protein [Chloroflexota bacterium]